MYLSGRNRSVTLIFVRTQSEITITQEGTVDSGHGDISQKIFIRADERNKENKLYLSRSKHWEDADVGSGEGSTKGKMEGGPTELPFSYFF
jgi:hypothetical protein